MKIRSSTRTCCYFLSQLCLVLSLNIGTPTVEAQSFLPSFNPYQSSGPSPLMGVWNAISHPVRYAASAVGAWTGYGGDYAAATDGAASEKFQARLDATQMSVSEMRYLAIADALGAVESAAIALDGKDMQGQSYGTGTRCLNGGLVLLNFVDVVLGTHGAGKAGVGIVKSGTGQGVRRAVIKEVAEQAVTRRGHPKLNLDKLILSDDGTKTPSIVIFFKNRKFFARSGKAPVDLTGATPHIGLAIPHQFQSTFGVYDWGLAGSKPIIGTKKATDGTMAIVVTLDSWEKVEAVRRAAGEVGSQPTCARGVITALNNSGISMTGTFGSYTPSSVMKSALYGSADNVTIFTLPGYNPVTEIYKARMKEIAFPFAIGGLMYGVYESGL